MRMSNAFNSSFPDYLWRIAIRARVEKRRLSASIAGARSNLLRPRRSQNNEAILRVVLATSPTQNTATGSHGQKETAS